jgi:hypothetical protein
MIDVTVSKELREYTPLVVSFTIETESEAGKLAALFLSDLLQRYFNDIDGDTGALLLLGEHIQKAARISPGAMANRFSDLRVAITRHN